LAWSLSGLALALLAATLLVLLAGRPPASSAGDSWQRQAADLLGMFGRRCWGVSHRISSSVGIGLSSAGGLYGGQVGMSWTVPAGAA
jgi:hypothetical protein